MAVNNGWTGGQYSVFRAVLGCYLMGLAVADFEGGAWGWAERALMVFAIGLIIGWQARWMAIAGGVLCFAVGWWPATAIAALTLAQALVDPAPYGSTARLGQADPGVRWRFPDWLLWVTRVLLVGHIVAVVLTQRHFAALPVMALAAFDPKWISPQGGLERELLFYDGSCGLCQRSVRFLLAEDRRRLIDFAPIQSRAFAMRVSEAERAKLPDSLVTCTADGRLLVKSASVLHLAGRLGGFWKVLASIARVVPTVVRDGVYDVIAANRKTFFKKPTDACPMIPSDLRLRFFLD